MSLRRPAFLLLLFLLTRPVFAYSVLSHEAVVDALWPDGIRPLLLAHYPNATADQLRQAHGYAYGGAIIQDLGYYPHGSESFSDLTHYVRTGDFIRALINRSQNLDELAFALGALSHYAADIYGHTIAVNVAEPILYPKLEKEFGAVITYEDNPSAHLRTEFGFDVLEVARGNFAPQAYHDYIGFYVAEDLLVRAFEETYGLKLSDLFRNFDWAVASYRSAVSRVIPLATRVAWAQQRDEIERLHPATTRREFVYTLRRAAYEKEWGHRFNEPSFWVKVLAFLVRLLPPVGPLRALHFKVPTPAVEQLFLESFNAAATDYHRKLTECGEQSLLLPNVNYDVGVVTRAGQYRLDDQVQILWLRLLAKKDFQTVTPAIYAEITRHFAGSAVSLKVKDKKQRKQFQSDYAGLTQAGLGLSDHHFAR